MQKLIKEVPYGGTNTNAPVLRELAASGVLHNAARAPGQCARLRSAAFELAMPLVWERHTRPLEHSKGHRGCASGMVRLAPECHDGFTDDLESVVSALLSYRRPISSLEGWITNRMSNAIKDGHRMRRAREMGAQQRVRVPAKLAALLDNDPWLTALAERVLRWTGVRHTAGTELWPLRAWAEDRAAFAGPAPGDPQATVAADLDVVLGAMRVSDPAWFDRYVEQPLGRKWAPVLGWSKEDDAVRAETDCLQLASADERNDAYLTEAAAVSLTMIRNALAAGTDARNAVVTALSANFMSLRALRGELDRPPGTDGTGEALTAILSDTGALSRLVPELIAIVGQCQ